MPDYSYKRIAHRLLPEQIPGLSTSSSQYPSIQFDRFSIYQIHALTLDQVAHIPVSYLPNVINKLTANQLSNLPVSENAGRKLTAQDVSRVIQTLPPEIVADMKPRQLKKRRWFVMQSIARQLLPEQISELDPRSLRRVVAQFNQEQNPRRINQRANSKPSSKKNKENSQIFIRTTNDLVKS